MYVCNIMYVYIYIYMHIHTQRDIHAYIYVYVYIYIYICMCICMYVCMHACMYACMYVCMNVCMCVYIYIHINAYIYIYMYVYTPVYMYTCNCISVHVYQVYRVCTSIEHIIHIPACSHSYRRQHQRQHRYSLSSSLSLLSYVWGVGGNRAYLERDVHPWADSTDPISVRHQNCSINRCQATQSTNTSGSCQGLILYHIVCKSQCYHQ